MNKDEINGMTSEQVYKTLMKIHKIHLKRQAEEIFKEIDNLFCMKGRSFKFSQFSDYDKIRKRFLK